MSKRLLITGANKANGIGIETLRLFLDAGFEAVVIARNFDDFEFAGNPKVTAIKYDLFDLSGIPELVKKIGHIDVLVNNSGINNSRIIVITRKNCLTGFCASISLRRWNS